MNQAMTYKNYQAKLAYSSDDSCFIGRILGINDIITFHGESVEEIKSAFEEAVDFYLDTCKARGESPKRPYSGKVMLRLPPELHASLAAEAATSGQSINQWAHQVLESAIKA